MLIRNLLLGLLLVITPSIRGTTVAATRHWDDGGMDNNWSTHANWNPQISPTALDAAVIGDIPNAHHAKFTLMSTRR